MEQQVGNLLQSLEIQPVPQVKYCYTCTHVQLTGQGSKLTFLGGHQITTEMFFSVARLKNVVAKKC